MKRVRDIAIAVTLCLAGLGFTIAGGVAWEIIASSACLAVVLAIFTVDRIKEGPS